MAVVLHYCLMSIVSVSELCSISLAYTTTANTILCYYFFCTLCVCNYFVHLSPLEPYLNEAAVPFSYAHYYVSE